MARITDFATLVAAVKDRADRPDMTDAQAEGFIQQAEDRLNRILRTWQMEETATLATDADGLAALPADFMSVRVVYDNENQIVPFANAEWVITAVQDAPKSYAIVDGGLRLAPAAAETLTLLYYEKIPALTALNTSNWLLARHPDIYLYGTLLAFADWRDEDAAIAKYDALFSRTLSEIITLEEGNRAKGPTRMPRDFLFGRYLAY